MLRIIILMNINININKAISILSSNLLIHTILIKINITIKATNYNIK